MQHNKIQRRQCFTSLTIGSSYVFILFLVLIVLIAKGFKFQLLHLLFPLEHGLRPVGRVHHPALTTGKLPAILTLVRYLKEDGSDGGCHLKALTYKKISKMHNFHQ